MSKLKVSDYIAGRVAAAGITRVFSVVGGGSMHLNDSFGHSRAIVSTYQHNEQACAMAAEAYARVDMKPACVIVTTGPGASNALTGCLCAWMESIPVLIISGQARYATTVRGMGLNLRSAGIQEYDITKSAAPMTKYAVMIEKAEDVRYHLERALHLMMSGRRGPVWLDVPLNVQAARIDPDELEGYDPLEDPGEIIPAYDSSLTDSILGKLRKAQRPVLFGGFGVRAAGAVDEFRELALLLGIPVLTGMSSVDLVPETFPMYAGRTGMTGGRAGNLTMAGSDLFFSVGSRLSFLQTGFRYEDWARGAYTIINEIDPEELKKPNVRADMPVICNAKDMLTALIDELKARGASEDAPWCSGAAGWLGRCTKRLAAYPPVTEAEKGPQSDGRANLYRFYDVLSDLIQNGDPLLVSVGTSRVAGTQAFRVKEGGRFYTNSATASMGYGLPASIGLAAAYAEKCPLSKDAGSVTVVNGEGCLMMNLQELQTIATNRLKVRVFVICNDGYHSIRQTQRAYFEEPLIGLGPDSGDLGFPPMDRLADTFGFSFGRCLSNETIAKDLRAAMELPLPALIEVRVSPLQNTEPKAGFAVLPDGSRVTLPLEDMLPLLPREKLAEELEVPMTYEESSAVL
ncbi:MAG: thiamine pyrophosphate-binding protein [Lachnospiraceae bacterium]|nr:thiamine pyrophosphate-binding protein [Lachnospiraceae bacterium]